MPRDLFQPDRRPLLSVRDLDIGFAQTTPVTGLSFDIHAGETLAIVGESGSGKSLSALAVMGLLPPAARITNGSIALDGQELTTLDDATLSSLRGDRMAMIFQEPMTSLNPVHSIGAQISEVVLRHRPVTKAEAWARAVEVLDRVKIPNAARRAHDYPHQLSGGQRQRVMIAMAIALEPRLLVADEPTTALDATVQAQVLELLDNLRRDLDMGLLLITHDLGVVEQWSDRVLVMHHGTKLDALTTRELHLPQRHPYTRGLMQASIHGTGGLHYDTASLPEIRITRDDRGAYLYGIQPSAPAAPFPLKAQVATPLLQVNGLSVDYPSANGKVRALDKVSLTLGTGETLGIVGESGSGKSTLSRAILQLVKPSEGSVTFASEEITGRSERGLRDARREMQMIFQDPFGSLNPRKTVAQLLETPLKVHGVRDKAERARRLYEALDHVGLPRAAATRLPHEFSGGQRQRIGIARALILRPKLIICDEPVSALDVSIQAQILNLLTDLKRDLGLSYLFISHDLAVVRYIADRVVVMRNAQIVEEADHNTIWTAPKSDYTRALIAAAGGTAKARHAADALTH